MSGAPARLGPTRLVAVDGAAGSGKTTLSARLARALGGAPVLDLDDLFTWADLRGEGWWARLEAEVLAPLAAGRPARFRARDWHGDPLGRGLGAWRTIPAAPVVALDGVSSSRRALAGRLALAVWVEAPRALRLERGLDRDGAALAPQWHDWMRQEDAFLAADRPWERADLVVDGDPRAPHDAEREVVLLPERPGQPSRST